MTINNLTRLFTEVSRQVLGEMAFNDLSSIVSHAFYTDTVEEKKVKLDQWSIGFTPSSLKYKVDETINSIYQRSNANQVAALKRPFEGGCEVGWDQGAIIEAGSETSIFSKEFSTCIAVLARGYKQNSDTPHYLALHHVFSNPHLFQKTLEDLVEKVQSGVIEIFISGGESATANNEKAIVNIINNVEPKDCKISICDNTFGITDLGDFYKISKSRFYPMSVGLSCVGISFTNPNPVQVVNLRDEFSDISDSAITQLYWAKTNTIKTL